MMFSRGLARSRAAAAAAAGARRGIAVGDNLLGTSVALQRARTWDEAAADGFEGVTLDALFKGRKVALFALPGAFTGVCENGHVPSFAARTGELRPRPRPSSPTVVARALHPRVRHAPRAQASSRPRASTRSRA